MTPIGVLGLTHTGAVMSVGWAALGCDVVAVDPNLRPLLALRREPEWETLLVRHRKRIVFDTRLERLRECRLVFATWDVPRIPSGLWDVGFVRARVRSALRVLSPTSLVLTSAVPPGFTRALAQEHPMVSVFYWAETLILGHAMERFLHPEQVILGTRDLALTPDVQACVDRVGPCPVAVLPYEEAELAKAAINAALSASVTLADALADLCAARGWEWARVAATLHRDARIGPVAYLRPGLGVAGTHLERDLLMLRDVTRADGLKGAEFFQALLDQHDRRREWVLQVGRPGTSDGR